MKIDSQDSAAGKVNDLSVKQVLTGLKSVVSYLKSRWLNIVITAILGAILGLGYSFYKKPVYTATCTFVLEEPGKGAGIGQYAGLASLAGISIGGGGGGIFEGDNIIELYKSRIMIEKTLLRTLTIKEKKISLIERYIADKQLRKKWKKEHIDSVSFNNSPETFTRLQDSIITDLVIAFNKKNLNVSKPDKKLNIIKVEFLDEDELFAKEFTLDLVENVNNFYIQTKTKKAYQDVLILQKQADSVKNVLNLSISGVASAVDASPNANPALLSLKVPSQKKQIDVQASSSIYGEIVKNLEISKISLRQEMPLIQVIDKPVLPLDKNYIGKIKAIILGGLIGIILAILILSVNKLFLSSSAIDK
jgi:hypothetical protein